MGLPPDNGVQRHPYSVGCRTRCAAPRRIVVLARSEKFLTLFAGMALGLFAQIGLITHLYLCPRLPFARSRRHRQCDVFTAADCPSRIS